MKNIITILTLLVFSITSNAQCSITKGSLDSGVKYFVAKSEKIHTNVDFENGLQSAYAHLTVIQSPNNPNSLQFFLDVKTAATGSKRKVVPSNITIKLKSGEIIDIRAEEVDVEYVGNIRMETGVFRLNADKYSKLVKNVLTKITIYDNRTGNQLNCYPYNGILQEQAICITNRVYP
jgi:hypothetical protein